MKKVFFTAIFILCFINTNSQNKKTYYAKYVKIHSFGEDSSIDTLNLYFNKQESLFVEIPKKNFEKIKITEDENDDYTLNIRINPPSEDDYAVYTNLKLKKIISRDFVYENGKAVSYIVDEDLNKPRWIISNDFKNIGKFKCRKAETTFRGRNYIAWFTESIQTTFAPWKLSGLPGLIVEVSDTTNSIQFYLIEYKNEIFYKIINPRGKNMITLKEYVTLNKKQSKKIIEHLKSKFPRGTTFTVESVETNPIELSYEWENKSY
ncbi:MAG: GLPGLI family protein [Polaribacter sp.]|nr:GLPGLI family protein [Polaribacter sp.]